LNHLLSLPQGQVTFALIPNGQAEKEAHPIAKVLLIDTLARSNQLTTNLVALRNKWAETGKLLKTETIRGFDFSVVQISTNDIPPTIRRLFPPGPQLQELGSESEAKKPLLDQLVFGQVESLLIASTSLSVVEKIVSQITGGSIPTLAELAAYNSISQAMFQHSPVYGWFNVKAYVQNTVSSSAEKSDSEGPDPFGNITPEKLISATGFGSLNTLAFAYEPFAEGSFFRVFAGAPENNRKCLLKIFGPHAGDVKPPSFVPADATKFQRWRIDTQKAWVALGKFMGDLYPQWIGGLDVLLDAANSSAKEKDPGFDLRTLLIGNLGDDVIRYEKPIGTKTASATLLLLGSPNPNQLATALKTLLVFVNQGAVPSEREFLGRKIFSLPMPNVALPMAGGASRPALARILHCTSSGGYVAISTDVAMLEDYMRSNDSEGKSLSENSGFMEAAQKVIGPGTALFGYENEMETTRPQFELLKKDGTFSTNSLAANLGGLLNVPNPRNAIRQLSDFSLLPSFDRLTKYFHFNVYSMSSTVDGLTFKFFAPTPPRLPEAPAQQ
jgi:hypothetical protein